MSKSKRDPKPLIDEDGEVRELLLEDIRRFRPAAEILPPSLLLNLGIKNPQQEGAGAKPARGRKRSAASAKLEERRRRASD